MLSTDLYAKYEAMRAKGRIFWSDEYFDGAWIVTSYEDVRATLQEPRLSAQRTDGWIMQPADREGRPRGELGTCSSYSRERWCSWTARTTRACARRCRPPFTRAASRRWSGAGDNPRATISSVA